MAVTEWATKSLPMFDPKADGCEFSPSCFTCPLPQCKHDMEPHEIQRIRTAAADDEMLRTMEEEGLTIAEVAEREGQYVKTIHRRLARIRARASRERA